MDLESVKLELSKMRGQYSEKISEDDIIQSVHCLMPLGDGFSILNLDGKKYIRSIPQELSQDLMIMLSYCSNNSPVTTVCLEKSLGWTLDRIQANMVALIKQKIIWVDEQGEETSYWVAGQYL